MKHLTRLGFFLVTLISVSIMIAGNGHAAQNNPVNIKLNGSIINLKDKPVIRNDRTLIPLRGFFEETGATVDWNKETRQAIIKNDDVEILLTAGSNYALANGKIVKFDTPSQIINDRIFIPIRFVAETMGHKVGWENNTRTVLVDIMKFKEDKTLPKLADEDEFMNLMKVNNSLSGYLFRDMRLNGGIMLKGGMGADESADMAAPTAKNKKSDHSDTNNQVEGVREADTVVTNGKYIATAYDGNNLVLVEVKDGEQKIAFETKLHERIIEMFIDEKTLTVISHKEIPIKNDVKRPYMYWYNHYKTNVTVFDISNLSVAKPKKLIDKDFWGNYKTSRLIGRDLHVITTNHFYIYRDMPFDLKQILPNQVDNLTKKTTTKAINDIYYFPGFVSPSITNIISINLNTGNSHFDSYLGASDIVYASKNAIYLAQENYYYQFTKTAKLYKPEYKNETNIYKFVFENGKTKYFTNGKVPGKSVNQFSMDEYKGDFRITTTIGEPWGNNEQTNNLFILDKNLKVISAVKDLAKGEKIYSTRFNGDRVYMVTYKQVDPLFVIDASDRLNPKVLGQLKIPGFSTYMHMLDENHILGFGTDTYEENGRIKTGGFKISLFDVTNPMKPKEKKTEVIGKRGTYSELKHNHKALMISLQKGIFAFPIQVSKETPYSNSFKGAYVYDVTTNDFKFRGSIENDIKLEKGFNNQQTKRLIYVGDYIYNITDRYIISTDLKTMERKGVLMLPKPTIPNFPVMPKPLPEPLIDMAEQK